MYDCVMEKIGMGMGWDGMGTSLSAYNRVGALSFTSPHGKKHKRTICVLRRVTQVCYPVE